jgi:hypothetical protein
MLETTIPDFEELYKSYMVVFDDVESIILNLDCDNVIVNLLEFQKELIKFDAKLRLGLAIRKIELNESYVRRKFGELRECHLMLYKLADIWFSYETFFKFHYLSFGVTLSARKIVWLNDSTNSNYSGNGQIRAALIRANSELKSDFNNRAKRQSLKEYITYCVQNATGGQQTRLNQIVDRIDISGDLPDFINTDFLTLTYAIRNNFVHNGEITIYPETFSYVLKNNLLKILYKYLVVVTICAAKITTEQKLRN